MQWPFVTFKRYIDLSLFCLRQKKKIDDQADYIRRLEKANEEVNQLFWYYKRKADRLSAPPRDNSGKFRKVSS